MLFTPSVGWASAEEDLSLIGILTTLGLTSNLSVCLDAGDINSYASGQTWTDTSGNSNNFVRGSSTSIQSSDPTFVGTPGGLSESEYWSFDGADYFAESATQTWSDDFHKDNANFTFVYLIEFSSSASTQSMAANCSSTTGKGIIFFKYSNNGVGFLASNGTSSPAKSINTYPVLTITNNTLQFIAISCDEATGTNALRLQVNGTSLITSATYSSPSSSNPSGGLQISGQSGANLMSNGTKLYGVMGWRTALGSSLSTLYDYLKDNRFTSLS